MADEQAINYIREAAQRGDSREKIKADFMAQGWNEAVVEQAIKGALDAPEQPGAKPAEKKKKSILPYIIIPVLIIILGAGSYVYFGIVRPMQSAFSEGISDVGSSPAEENLSVEQPIQTQQNMSIANGSVFGSQQPQISENGTVLDALKEAAEQLAAERELKPLPSPCPGTAANCSAVAVGIGGPAAMASIGSEYGVFWVYSEGGTSKLYFARLDLSGNKLGKEAEITKTAENSKRPSVVWTGSNYGVLWPAGKYLYLMQIGMDGKMIGSAIDLIPLAPMSADAESVSLAWNGSVYGVAWNDVNSKSYFAMVDTAGNKIGEVASVGITSSQKPTVASAKSEFGVSWVENTGAGKVIYLARFGSEGEKISTIKIVNDYIFCDELDLAWANSNYGMAYSCIMDNTLTNADRKDIHFMRVHSTGGAAEMIELDQGIVQMTMTDTFSRKPSIFMNENNYGMAWEDARDGNSEIYFGRLFVRTGTKKEDEFMITNSAAESHDVFLVHDGNRYGAVWLETASGQTDLWFGAFK